MGLESKKGGSFYKEIGLKPVTVYLSPKAYEKLKRLAKKQDRSVQKTLRRILSLALKISVVAIIALP